MSDTKQIDYLTHELDVFLLDRFNYKRSVAFCYFRNITARRKKFDLYFRYFIDVPPDGDPFWHNDTLVIARIYFTEERRGHGSALLRRLVDLAPRFGYTRIGIESANKGISIQNFICKFGFSPYKRTKWDGSWIAPVCALREHFPSIGD